MTANQPANTMASEPARKIGQIFADKTMLKPVISAIVALLAGVLKITVADDLIENITTVVMFAAILWTPIAANKEQSKLATDQAETTRNAVYAPRTVERIAARAARTGDTSIDPPPAQ